ncbi:hypothetical protein ACI2IY_23440 [Lysobacter enzymogenes]|uniref:hypothetical protein n=1 Tax=Lysobacter enzymogenes TaxID=69 RepID=UPI00384F607A
MKTVRGHGYALFEKLSLHALLVAIFVPLSAFAAWDSFGDSRWIAAFAAAGALAFFALLAALYRPDPGPAVFAACMWLLLVTYAGVFGLNALLFVSGCVWWGALNGALTVAALALAMTGVGLATHYAPRWGSAVATAMCLLITLATAWVSIRAGATVFFPFMFAPILMIGTALLSVAVWRDGGDM